METRARPGRWERALEKLGARPLPFFGFLIAAAALVALQVGSLRATTVRAVAWAQPIVLSAPAQTTVVEVHVRAGDRVAAGATIARLDDHLVRRELLLVEAELEAVTREAELAQLTLVEEVARERREALRRVGEAKASSGRARADEEVRARLLQAIAAQATEIRARHDARLAAETDLRDADRRLAEGEAVASEASALARSEAERVRALETALPREGLPVLARPTAELYEAKLAALRLRRATLQEQLTGLVVTARAPGLVVRVAAPGTALAQGAAVAELVVEEATELVAWLPPEAAGERVDVGAKLVVAVAGCNGEARVLGGAGSVVEAPPWLSTSPLRAGAFGQPVRALVPAGCRLVPGRVVVAELHTGTP